MVKSIGNLKQTTLLLARLGRFCQRGVACFYKAAKALSNASSRRPASRFPFSTDQWRANFQNACIRPRRGNEQTLFTQVVDHKERGLHIRGFRSVAPDHAKPSLQLFSTTRYCGVRLTGRASEPVVPDSLSCIYSPITVSTSAAWALGLSALVSTVTTADCVLEAATTEVASICLPPRLKEVSS